MKDTKKVWLSIVAVLLVLLVGGTVWGVMTSGEPTITADEYKQKGKDLREKMKTEGKDMTEEQRREVWSNYRKDYEKLPFEERKKLHEGFEKREMERLDKYYTASKEEQEAQITKSIDRWEETYNKMQARRAENGGEGGGNRPQGGGPNAQAGPPAGDGNGPGGRGGPSDPAVRDKRRREFLDMSTPEARAKRSDHRMVLKEAAKERGLPEPRFGGFGGGPPGGGRGPGGGGPGGGGPRGGGGGPGGGNQQPATPPVTP